MQAHGASGDPGAGVHDNEHTRLGADADLGPTEMARWMEGRLWDCREGAEGHSPNPPPPHAGHQAAETKRDAWLIPLFQPATSQLLTHTGTPVARS